MDSKQQKQRVYLETKIKEFLFFRDIERAPKLIDQLNPRKEKAMCNLKIERRGENL